MWKWWDRRCKQITITKTNCICGNTILYFKCFVFSLKIWNISGYSSALYANTNIGIFIICTCFARVSSILQLVVKKNGTTKRYSSITLNFNLYIEILTLIWNYSFKLLNFQNMAKYFIYCSGCLCYKIKTINRFSEHFHLR